MFQSLFLWNSRPDGRDERHSRQHLDVSILVFVELAPGRDRPTGPGIDHLVSILVFVELAPGQ